MLKTEMRLKKNKNKKPQNTYIFLIHLYIESQHGKEKRPTSKLF